MYVHLVLIFVAFLWGLNPPVMKFGLPYVEPMPYNTLRMLVALAGSWVVLKLLACWQPLQKESWQPLIISSLGFFVFSIFLTYGVQTTTAGNCSLIMACVPLSVALINHFYKFEKISKKMILSIFISFFGVLIMVAGTGSEITFSDNHALGAAMILLAQLGYAYYTVFSRILTNSYSAYQVTVYILLISSALFVLVSLPSLAALDWLSVPPIAWGSILYSGLFPLCVGNVLWIWGVKILGSAKCSLYNNLPPVFAVIAAYLLLSEPFSLLQFVGAVVIFVGIYFAKGVKSPSSIS